MAEKSRLPIGLPALIGLVVLALFIPWVILTGKSERDTRRAIVNYQPFSQPAFDIRFSKTIKFDPLGFMGTGIEAGWWEWTPNGMALAEKGRAYFADTPEAITSLVGSGRRVISSFDGFQDRGGKRDVRFHWRWAEITPPAQLLLSRKPQINEDYEGHAVLSAGPDGWRVEKLETPDFDIPMALLRDTVAGIQH